MIRRRPPLVTPPRRRTAQEPIVAMINVVFLLLIFFLMTAQIAPPDPFDITLPTATAEPAETAEALYLSADGAAAYRDLRGDAALRAAARNAPLALHADATLDALILARTVTQLRTLGAAGIHLVTHRQTP